MIQVVHTTAGRFRIRVPQVLNDLDYANKLDWLVKSLDFVRSVRINQSAGSLIVCYDGAVSTAEAQKEIFNCIQLASVVEIPSELQSTVDEVKPIRAWEHLALPITVIGTALAASLLELSIPLVTGGLIAAAALPVFHRAIAGVVDERKLKVDVLDSLWIALQTSQGQYIAPALMLGLVESAATIRDLTAISAQHRTVELPFSQPSLEVSVTPDLEPSNVTNTEVGENVEAIADGLILPTLLLSGGIFVLTGNVAPALAPLQLDFATGIGTAIPTTILTALNSAMRSGAYIRHGSTIEALAKIDTIVFATPLPPNSTNEIATLTAQGIKTYLLTDEQQAITNTKLAAVPEVKIEELRMLHNVGKTIAYVGNRSSDRDLACVDVFICLAEGADIAEETADVVLIAHDLEALIQAIEIAKQAMTTVYQNIAIVAVPNVSVAIAGMFFGLHPITAVLINFSAALIAEINGLRPLLSVIYQEKAIKDTAPITVLPT